MQNKLHMRGGEISVPFLSEGEIKKNMFEEEKDAMMNFKPNESDVKEIMSMGYTREKVIEALKISEGNKEHAVNYLMSAGTPTR